ncbi:M28 family peptidase [Flammeovirga kamogawensis]|uniref:M28 family peptidase n=1 Tax=Flammeovirga kamogawensis TaxID=373891 RepID=A0ABX8GZJ5_9BACT|nr:M28 family peptidase [Flammeovirga kamogawensis]MBB6459258.1 hypothetical protein [Flammeovirga kamogawensis]QWG08819.1 M28 family peptidase [Flammeovirga kamogawensis]TRX67109.1 M28 family peptidase [Flammeovirga kamogawensis]
MIVYLLTILLFILFLIVGTAIYSVYLPVSANFDTKIAASVPASAQELEKHVRALCSTTGFRNYTNKVAQAEAVDYIQQSFESFGYQTHIQEFLASGEPYKNIIAFYGDPKKDRIVVGAHYDAFGEQHGADDNASGIAGVLEIARLLNVLQPKLNYCIELVAYANEERPFFTTKDMGSYVHAKTNIDNNVHTVLMVCLEMIGYFDEKEGTQDYPIKALNNLYPKSADFIALVGNLKNHSAVMKFKTDMKKSANIGTYSINAPSSIKGLANSDHRNYWQFGQNAIMVTDTSYFRNPNYHQLSDSPESLDYKKTEEVIRGTYYAITQY